MTQQRDSEAVVRQVLCPAQSGMGLHCMVYSEWGDAANPKVLLCAHGLARNGRDFDELARALSPDFRVICPDVAGRGRSEWLRDPGDYGMRQYISDMMVLIARLDVEQVLWLGTSMGGLIGMVLASLEHSPIRRLLLNDVGPVLAHESIRRIGEYIGRAPSFDSLAEAEKYIRLVSAPFGALSDAQWRDLTLSSVRTTPDGRLQMGYDPAIAESFRRATAAADINLWPVYERIVCPTLVVRGAESDLLSADTAKQMALRGPCPEIVEVPGVGHAPMFMNESQIAIAKQFFTSPDVPG